MTDSFAKARANPGVYHVILNAEDIPELAKIGAAAEKDRLTPEKKGRKPRAYVVLDTRAGS